MLQEERPLQSQISLLILTLSSRGWVFLDLLNTLDRRPRPKSLRRAGLGLRCGAISASAKIYLCLNQLMQI